MRATEEARNVLIETILDVYIEGKFDAMIIKEDERKKKSECIIGKKGKKSKEMDLVSSWPLYLFFMLYSREVN